MQTVETLMPSTSAILDAANLRDVLLLVKIKATEKLRRIVTCGHLMNDDWSDERETLQWACHPMQQASAFRGGDEGEGGKTPFDF